MGRSGRSFWNSSRVLQVYRKGKWGGLVLAGKLGKWVLFGWLGYWELAGLVLQKKKKKMEDDPFDFESDVLLATSSVLVPTKKKKVVIGLDDLLVDHYKEKNRVVERESKLAKTKKIYANSDDEEDGRVAKLSKYVDECHEK
nr:hypothetical protein CTI12_AA185830 [Tanacetum cinerariifolium]